MSEIRRQRETQVRKIALQVARAQGCTCQPDYEVVGWIRDTPEVALKHDDWCPLLRVMEERGPDRGPQVLFWKREEPDA